MDYPRSVRFLESFKGRGIKLGLDRVRAILSKLDDPQNSFLSIHIAGTNGKGSVAAMLSSILTKSGFRTGLYTSPHLVDYTERVRINEQDISKRDFAEAVAIVKKTLNEHWSVILTEFEVITVAGFLMLKRAKVEVAVIETGLGGRLDATNVVTPLISIITNIDMDHMDLLGNSINSIAREKAGIIKPGVPVITGATKGLETIRNICKKKVSKLIVAHSKPELKLSLSGEHQKSNAAIVVRAVDELRKLGLDIEQEALTNGLKSTKWLGRLQVVSRKPLTILDGAHNVAGAKALSAYLSSLGKKVSFVIGMQKNKDIKGYLEIIRPLAEKFYVVQSSNPGAISKLELARMIGPKAIISTSLSSAVKSAKAQALPVCITGSLYLVGDFLKG
jgi:dihydrofolate synthase / folylpolyglutamate synthase